MFEVSSRTAWPRVAVTIVASLATMVRTGPAVGDASTAAPPDPTLGSAASPAAGTPPAKDPRLGHQADVTETSPGKRMLIEDPATGAGPGERGADAAILGSWRIGRSGPDASEPDDSFTPRLRLQPGRYRPDIAPPGVGIPVEAVVLGSRGAGWRPGDGTVLVFVHVRPHPSLAWSTIEMRPLLAAPERFQAVLPCAPCHTRPEFWLQAIALGPDGGRPVAEAWWPPAGASHPARYEVGYERVLERADGAVLERFGTGTAGAAGPRPGGGAGGPGGHGGEGPGRRDREQDGREGRGQPRGMTSWTSPAWAIDATSDPLVAFGWTLEAADSRSRLMVAVRPGGMGPWTAVAELEGSGPRFAERRIPVRDHLPGAAMVQVRVQLVADGDAIARIWDPRLVDIACTPGFGPDLDGDGQVGLSDLLRVITVFGPCGQAGGCVEDLDGNGIIDLMDALEVLSTWTDAEAAPAAA
jgi:hypothetical protein